MADQTTPTDEPLTRPLSDEISAAVAEDLENFDSAAAEHGSEKALSSSSPDVPSSGLLSFYDRLRERIIKAVCSSDPDAASPRTSRARAR